MTIERRTNPATPHDVTYVTTVAEPEWDEQTRETVMALEQVDLCPLCGRPSEVCQDPAREFDWQVAAPVRCHATTALHRAQQAITEDTNPQHMALLWDVQLRRAVTDG